MLGAGRSLYGEVLVSVGRIFYSLCDKKFAGACMCVPEEIKVPPPIRSTLRGRLRNRNLPPSHANLNHEPLTSMLMSRSAGLRAKDFRLFPRPFFQGDLVNKVVGCSDPMLWNAVVF